MSALAIVATHRRHAARLLGLAAVVLAILLAFFRPSGQLSELPAASVSGGAYWLATAGGKILNFGGAAAFDPVPSTSIVGVAGTASGDGLWLVGRDGGVFSRGDAAFFGSLGALKLNQPIVGIAGTPSGQGYWLVASDGGLFAFGDAGYYGSLGALVLNKPIVGLAATPSGLGYWMVASDGGMFAFGDAAFHGSMGGTPLNKPVVGMAAGQDGAGYWLVASDGGTFSFGNAGFHGSTGALKLVSPIVAIAPTPAADGYWMVSQDGGVFAFDAPFLGSAASRTSAATVSASGDVYVGMAVANAKPDAKSDTASVAEDGSVNVAVLANDKYLTDTPLTVKIGADDGPKNGTVVVKSDQTVTYTPKANFNGSDSFRYKVTDKDGDKDSATVTITVTAVNDAPKISNLSDKTINEDGTTGSIAFTVSDADNSDGALTVTATSSNTALVPNANLTLGGSGSNRTLTATPAANANGSTVITVNVSDGSKNDTDTFTLTVTAVNDAPVAANGTLTVAEDDPATAGSLSASDAESSPLTYSLVGANGGAAHGTVVITSAATGAYTYTPAANYNGSDSFSFKANDGALDSNTATVSVTVTTVNDAPVISEGNAPLALSVDEDVAKSGTISATDLDNDPTTLTYSVAVDGDHGTVTGVGVNDGSYLYTPDPDFDGTDSFTLQVSDGNGGTDTVVVNVTMINLHNDAPVFGAGGDSGTGDEETLISGTVSATDPDTGDTLAYSIESGDEAADGTAAVNATTGAWTYTGDLDFAGTDSFTITVTDGDGLTDTIVVNVTVDNLNDAPVIDENASDLSRFIDLVVTGQIQASDPDDGDTLSYSIDGAPADISIDANGNYSWTFGAPLTFTVRVSDGNGGDDSAVVNVII